MECKRKFAVFGTHYLFVLWLESWQATVGEFPNIQIQRNADGTYTAHLIIPEQYRVEGRSNRVTFEIVHKDVEHLEVTAFYEDDEKIVEFVEQLIQDIVSRWSQQIEVPDFDNVVDDEELAQLLKDRWIECERANKAEAHLSAIILLGSILEGVLIHKIESNPREANEAKSSPKSQGKTKPFNEWKLNDMIAVARELGWLDRDIHGASEALREYRNLIHPKEQVKTGIYPDDGTYSISKPVVLAALSDLKRIKKKALGGLTPR